MTDRELLEAAAKAASIANTVPTFWSPLTDDGDALRLAVQLGLYVDIDKYRAKSSDGIITECIEPLGADPCAATRRAIVRAAAAIGHERAG